MAFIVDSLIRYDIEEDIIDGLACSGAHLDSLTDEEKFKLGDSRSWTAETVVCTLGSNTLDKLIFRRTKETTDDDIIHAFILDLRRAAIFLRERFPTKNIVLAPLTPRKVKGVFTERLGRNIHHQLISEARQYGTLFRLNDPKLTYAYHVGVFEQEGSPRRGVYGQDDTHFNKHGQYLNRLVYQAYTSFKPAAGSYVHDLPSQAYGGSVRFFR